MTTLFGYHALREREVKCWRRQSPAKALTAKGRHRAANLQTLMRALVPYPVRRGGDLAIVAPVRADRTVERLCVAYRAGTALERRYIRSRIPARWGGVLLCFSGRAAVRALRAGDVELIRNSLAAQAIENLACGDVRDNLVTLGVVYHCACEIHPRPKSLFLEAAKIAGPAMTAVFRDFAARKDLKDILGAMGFCRVHSPVGVGFREDWE